MQSPWIVQWVLGHLREIQKRQKRKREYNTGGGDWSHAAISQGMPTTIRIVK